MKPDGIEEILSWRTMVLASTLVARRNKDRARGGPITLDRLQKRPLFINLLRSRGVLVPGFCGRVLADGKFPSRSRGCSCTPCSIWDRRGHLSPKESRQNLACVLN